MTETHVKLVGPLIRGLDVELTAAIESDNPGAEVVVEDQGGYIRINVADRCRLTRASLEEVLDREFPLSQLEPALSGFAGRMRSDDTEIVWYLERQD
jgi:toluene monooxygenase system protein D